MEGGAGGAQEPRRGEVAREEEAGRQTRVAEVGGGGGMKFRVSARAPHGVGALLLIGGAVVAGAGVVAWRRARRAKRDSKLSRKEEEKEEEVLGGGGVVEDGKGGTVAPEIDQPVDKVEDGVAAPETDLADAKDEHGALAPEIDRADDDKVDDGALAPEIDRPDDKVDDGKLAPEIDQPGDKVEGDASAPETDQPDDDKVEEGSPAPETDQPDEEVEDRALAQEIDRPDDEVDGGASPRVIDQLDNSLMGEVEKTEIGSNGLDNGEVAEQIQEVHREEEIVTDELGNECAEDSDLVSSKNSTEIPVHDDADSEQVEKSDHISIPKLPEVITNDMDTVTVEEVEENSTKEDTENDHNSINNDADNDQSPITNHIHGENTSKNNLKEEIAVKENEDVEASDECAHAHSKSPRIVLDEQITSDAAQEAESMENSPTAKLMVDPEQLMDDHSSLNNDTDNDQHPITNHTEDENSSKNDLKEENIVDENLSQNNLKEVIATKKNEDVEEASSKSPRIILDEQITSDGAQEAESMENSPTAQLMMHPEQLLDDMATDTESNAAEANPEATVPDDEDADQQEHQEPDRLAGSPALPPSPVKPMEEKEPEVIETGMKIEQDYPNSGLKKEHGVVTNSKGGAAPGVVAVDRSRRSSSLAILALMLTLIVLGIAVAVQLYAPQHATKVLMDLQGAVDYVNNKWRSRSA